MSRKPKYQEIEDAVGTRDCPCRPEWDKGVPLHNDGCPNYDGKRCEAIGFQPDRFCEPCVIEMARRCGLKGGAR